MAHKKMTARDFGSGGIKSPRSGSGYLQYWKSTKNMIQTDRGRTAEVDVYLATEFPVTAVFSHPWPELEERKGQSGVSTKEWWTKDWNCLESYETCDKQFFRLEDGSPEYPPCLCPLHLMVEYCRQLVEQAVLPVPEGTPEGCDRVARMMTPVFQFGEGEKAIVLYAGGMAGMIGYGFRTKNEDEAFTEIERNYLYDIAGIHGKNSWKLDIMARRQVVVLAIDAKKPAEGIKVTTETSGLGNALEDLINSQQRLAGDPINTPYCIRWIYCPDETDPKAKYQATLNSTLHPDAATIELIQTGKPPRAYEQAIGYKNIHTLRASMEEHALLELPWDQFFAPAEKISNASGIPQLELADVQLDAPDGPTVEGFDDGGEMQPCETCGEPLALTATECPGCGTKYDVLDEDPPSAEGDAGVPPDDDDIPF